MKIYMLISSRSHIEDYWSLHIFLGCEAIKDLSSCKTFSEIRSFSRVYLSNAGEYETCTTGLLWHPRFKLKHFVRSCVDIVVPQGMMTLNKNTVRAEAQTDNPFFIPSKPIKLGIRFYVFLWSPVRRSTISGIEILEIKPIFTQSIHFYESIGVFVVSSCVIKVLVSFLNHSSSPFGLCRSLYSCS